MTVVPAGTGPLHECGTYRALGFGFAFRATNADVCGLLGHLYSSCAADVEPDITYTIVEGDEWGTQIYVNGAPNTERHEPPDVLRFITWHVNREVIRRSKHLVLIHAAAAAKEGRAVILPGVAEAGKTTLVAALVTAGLRYLTDEVAALSPRDLLLHPYPKPLSIDPGSWPVLSDLDPRQGTEADAYFDGQWFVNPGWAVGGPTSAPVRPSLIVFPTYVERAPTTIEPVGTKDTLLMLMQQTFRFHEAGGRNIRALATLSTGVRAFRLVSGNLGAACEAVLSLVEGSEVREGS